MLTLIGDSPYTVEASSTGNYVDPGATASVPEDGDLSGSVGDSGQVDLSVPGTYLIDYDVQDSDGNDAETVTRTVTVQDTLRPIIALSYDGEVLQVGDHSDIGIGGVTNSPDGLPSETSETTVGDATRSGTWTLRLPAGQMPSEDAIPTADAWDLSDPDVAPARSIYIIDRDGTSLNDSVALPEFNNRSTYLFQYDAQDQAGNHADQVVFALILDDQVAPTITRGDASETVEAASDWTLAAATASDNIDGDLTANIIYSVENVTTSTTLGTDLTYAEAAALFNTTQVGNYLVTMQVSDAAGIYGSNNQNNTATAQKAISIQDTLAPVITLTGGAVVNVNVDPSGTYTDAGATAVDSFDGDLTGSVVVGGDVVDLSQAGTYTLTYNVSDNAGNAADQVTRTVNVTAGGGGGGGSDAVVIIDNTDAGFAENGFTHLSNAQVAAAYDGDVHHMQGGSGSASWTFTGLPADRYQVAATWAFKYNNNYNAEDAPFTLSDGAGGVFSTQIVNQKNTPSEFEDAGYFWDTLDTVEVSGGTLVVTVGAVSTLESMGGGRCDSRLGRSHAHRRNRGCSG